MAQHPSNEEVCFLAQNEVNIMLRRTVFLFSLQPPHQNLPESPRFRLPHPKTSPQHQHQHQQRKRNNGYGFFFLATTLDPNPRLGRQHQRPKPQDAQDPEGFERHQGQAVDCCRPRGSRGVLYAVCGDMQGWYDGVEEEGSEEGEGEDQGWCYEGDQGLIDFAILRQMDGL